MTFKTKQFEWDAKQVYFETIIEQKVNKRTSYVGRIGSIHLRGFHNNDV